MNDDNEMSIIVKFLQVCSHKKWGREPFRDVEVVDGSDAVGIVKTRISRPSSSNTAVRLAWNI